MLICYEVDKEYTLNIPAYAVLQAMGAATCILRRLYADGRYTVAKSPYFDQITTLLKAASKYVAGGQLILPSTIFYWR